MSGYQEKRFDSEGAISGPQDTIMKQVSDSMSAYVDCEGNASQVPIALCGFGLRLPGGICNGQGFWQLIVNGRDARDLGASSSYFLDGDDLASFDSSMAIYNGGGEELELDCSPQERKILEIVRECLEDACEINYRAVDARVECYINSYTQGSRSIANCVSREYDFQGPRCVYLLPPSTLPSQFSFPLKLTNVSA